MVNPNLELNTKVPDPRTTKISAKPEPEHQIVQSKSKTGLKDLNLSEVVLPRRGRDYEPSHGYIKNKHGSDLHLIQVKASSPSPATKDAAVLFVPGFWSTATMNFSAMKELSQHGISSFAFSQEGHGRSSENQKGKINYSINRYLENLDSIVEALHQSGIKKVHLVGHSFGGYLVQKYLATKETKGIGSATLIDSLPPSGNFMANLRFAINEPWTFLKANLTLDASKAVQDPRVAAKLLFSTTPENIPKTCQLAPESLLANFQAILPINTAIIKSKGIPITVIGSTNDRIISEKEVQKTALAYATNPQTISGPHMWMADPEARGQFVKILAENLNAPL